MQRLKRKSVDNLPYGVTPSGDFKKVADACRAFNELIQPYEPEEINIRDVARDLVMRRDSVKPIQRGVYTR